MNLGTIAIIGSILAGLMSIPATGAAITGDVVAAGSKLTGISNDSFQKTPRTVSEEISPQEMSKTVRTAFGTVKFHSSSEKFSADLENPQYHLEITREAGEESRVFTSGSVRLQIENSPTAVKETCETPEGTLETSLEEGVEKTEFSGVNRNHVEKVCERARERMKQKIAKVQSIAADLGLIPDLEISRINETKEEAVVRNSGENTVNLAGWTLSDGSDNSFDFGPLSLKPGETVTVYSSENLDQEDCEESSAPDYERCWDNSYVWNNDGETATLTNARGDTADSLTYQ